MIDIKLLERDYVKVKEQLLKKGIEQSVLDNVLVLNKSLKSMRKEVENIKAEINKDSKLYGELMKSGENADELKEEIISSKSQLKQMDMQLEKSVKEIKILMDAIPNIPSSSVPIGEDEEHNIVLDERGSLPIFKFQPKNHWDLSEGRIDFKRGVKLSKSRFSVLVKDTAKLERALINFFLDENAKVGFEETSVPIVNNEGMLYATGQLPKFKDDLFKIEGEDLYLIPTSEVPLTNLYNDEILKEEDLPVMLTASTQCFRKEAGSAGKDTRGIIRQHQFSKVEIVSLTKPEKSDEMLNKMVEHISSLLSKLGLPHRLVMLCGGDLGFSSSKTIDLEVWLPGEGKYREISSVSNMTDFQSRRAKIRYKDTELKNNILVHTLNGSALAVGRTIVAIMENYQNEDGSIGVPSVLEKYL